MPCGLIVCCTAVQCVYFAIRIVFQAYTLDAKAVQNLKTN